MSSQMPSASLDQGSLLQGFQGRRPSHVPLLTQRHEALHLTWSRQHRHWILNDWKNDVLYDESCFQLYRNDCRVRVWGKPHKIKEFSCLQGTFQAGGDSVMEWGVCSLHEMGPFMRLHSTMTNQQNVNILSDHLYPFLSSVL
ncbi:transposable element Tcb2 transposase [Trichonephila clavipes]|nr:transposable element Tcb2 transposase [Trichonephila clavipes]